MKILGASLALGLALCLSWYDAEIFRAEYHFQKGEDARRQQDFAGALTQYEKAAQILPARSSYQRAVGRTSYQLYQAGSGNLRPLYRSDDAYQRVLQLDPLYPYGWFERADVLDDFERAKVPGLPSAEKYYRRALEIDPSNPRFLAGLLDWKLRHGQKEAAWVLFFELIRVYPQAIKEIGPALLQSDRDFARLGREIDPAGPAAIVYAKYLAGAGRGDDALCLLGKLKGGRDTRLEVARLESDLLLKRGETGKAREVLTNALTLDPEDLSLNTRLATILIRQGDEAGALAVYLKAMAYHPQRWDVAWMAAQAAMRTGRDEEAIDLLTRVLDTGESDANFRKTVLKLRADLRAKRHDFGAAIADYERLLELDPGNEEIIHAIKKTNVEMEYASHSGG